MIGVEPITMDRAAAKEAYLEYRRAVLDGEGLPGDRQAMKAYLALSRGHRVIDVERAMQLAGCNPNGSPKLAIVRADAKLCFATRRGATRGIGQLLFGPTNTLWRQTAGAVKVDNVRPPADKHWDGQRWRDPSLWSGRAVVPTIPPSLRPTAKLSNYHLLWEAEWETVPVDPMLLKHLGGTLYAVLAEWDLTPVEQAVLRGAEVRG